MSNPIQIHIGIDCVTADTPSLPDAKRGAVAKPPITETAEQLEAGLVWWPCSFCDARVLISAGRRTREKCECGAVRVHSHGAEGWRKDGGEWWFI
jgi:hypothetical protein